MKIPSSAPVSPRRPYSAPWLSVIGDVVALTGQAPSLIAGCDVSSEAPNHVPIDGRPFAS